MKRVIVYLAIGAVLGCALTTSLIFGIAVPKIEERKIQEGYDLAASVYTPILQDLTGIGLKDGEQMSPFVYK